MVLLPGCADSPRALEESGRGQRPPRLPDLFPLLVPGPPTTVRRRPPPRRPLRSPTAEWQSGKALLDEGSPRCSGRVSTTPHGTSPRSRWTVSGRGDAPAQLLGDVDELIWKPEGCQHQRDGFDCFRKALHRLLAERNMGGDLAQGWREAAAHLDRFEPNARASRLRALVGSLCAPPPLATGERAGTRRRGIGSTTHEATSSAKLRPAVSLAALNGLLALLCEYQPVIRTVAEQVRAAVSSAVLVSPCSLVSLSGDTDDVVSTSGLGGPTWCDALRDESRRRYAHAERIEVEVRMREKRVQALNAVVRHWQLAFLSRLLAHWRDASRAGRRRVCGDATDRELVLAAKRTQDAEKAVAKARITARLLKHQAVHNQREAERTNAALVSRVKRLEAELDAVRSSEAELRAQLAEAVAQRDHHTAGDSQAPRPQVSDELPALSAAGPSENRQEDEEEPVPPVATHALMLVEEWQNGDALPSELPYVLARWLNRYPTDGAAAADGADVAVEQQLQQLALAVVDVHGVEEGEAGEEAETIMAALEANGDEGGLTADTLRETAVAGRTAREQVATRLLVRALESVQDESGRAHSAVAAVLAASQAGGQRRRSQWIRPAEISLEVLEIVDPLPRVCHRYLAFAEESVADLLPRGTDARNQSLVDISSVLADNASAIHRVYRFYCTCDSRSVNTTVSMPEFKKLLADCGIKVAEAGRGEKQKRLPPGVLSASDFATLWAKARQQERERRGTMPRYDARDELAQPEFVSALLRLAAQLPPPSPGAPLHEKMRALLEERIIPNASAFCFDGFQAAVRTEPVQRALAKYRSPLRRLLHHYGSHVTGAGLDAVYELRWADFRRLCDDAKLADSSCSTHTLHQLFVGTGDCSETARVALADFGELICSLAMVKLPSPFVPVEQKLRRFMDVILIPPLATRLRLAV
eukprot:TRINITY_DN9476_c0_g1_i1.p1 TRINITY_DN9476_c0_g1~~TRINITY_DN9476_c0_g1_i1.p1  ORF type:complete len:931 (+),score=229.47 TRINITY_DN9476_c0_g1_i1:60-2852(+)